MKDGGVVNEIPLFDMELLIVRADEELDIDTLAREDSA